MRHPRSAALLTAAALAGVSLSLALAPSALADIPTPPLGTLTADPSAPVAGDVVHISGDGCLTLASRPSAGGSAPAGTAATAAATAAVAPAAALDDPTPTAGAVSITITGPDSFSSNDTATASDDGTWSADQGIKLGGGGDYTVTASCTLTDPDPVLGQTLSFDYDALDLTVAAPPTTVDPVLNCSGCESVNPGGNFTVSGTGFPTGTAMVALAGYTSQASRVDADGALAPVSFIIRADQAAGSVSGTVTAGAATVPFTVTVTLPKAPGGDVDGNVPGDNSGTDTGSGSGDTDTTPTVDVPYIATAPSLPNTGTDSLWQGVLGGALLLTGGGLLWLGRRREDSGVTAA